MRRRAQIRGIDFTIALIIYILIMSQIIVLTTNLLQTTQQIQINDSQSVSTNIIANTLMNLPGNPANWETQQSSTLTNWNLGLKGNSDQLSPYKINRLADNNLADYQLNYTQIQAGLNTFGNPFQLEVQYPISITTNITAADPVLTVTGVVQQELQPLSDADIIVFAIDGTNTISAQTTSGNQGIYSVDLTFPVALPQYAVIVALAKYGEINQAVDIKPFENGGLRNHITLSVFSDSSSGSTVNVTLGTTRTPNIYALFFPIGANQVSNFTAVATASAALNIPQSGIVAIVSMDNIEVSYTAFPVALDNDISATYEPTNPAGDSVVISRSFAVRGIIMKLLLTIWEV